MKLLLFISLVMFGCYAKNDVTGLSEQSGLVIKIVDGDTYDILLANHITKRIRMEGIDAPERGMPFYRVAKDYLGKICFNKTVRIIPTSTDRNGRVIAKTFIADGSEVGLMMIKAGYAWHFKKYSSDIQLARSEIEAKNSKTGLWVDEMPIAPWDWRKSK